MLSALALTAASSSVRAAKCWGVADGYACFSAPRTAEAAASDVLPKVGGDCSCMRGEVGTRGDAPEVGLLLQVGEFCSDNESTGGPTPLAPAFDSGASLSSRAWGRRELWCCRGLWGSGPEHPPRPWLGPPKGEQGEAEPEREQGEAGSEGEEDDSILAEL